MTAIGSFKDAELENIKRIAALAPAQRVKMVCSMQSIVRRVQSQQATVTPKAGARRADA